MIKLKVFFQEIKNNWGKNKGMLLILGFVGFFLLIWPINCAGNETESARNIVTPAPDCTLQLQSELEKILANIEGCGKVSVMVTFEEDGEVVYAVNEDVSRRNSLEEDTQGGVRKQLDWDSRGQLVIVQTSGKEEAVVVKVIKPKVRGVLVVATGAGNPLVREKLIHAIQGVLAVPAYRITVQKGN